MNLATKIVVVVLAVGVVSFGVAFGFSRYLVSKLDGAGGVSAPQEAMQQYASEDGFEFKYPERYELSSRTEGNAERQWDVLLLLPKGYTPPQGGEGPPAISVVVFSNLENTPLEQWIKGDARSNYKLSSDGKLQPVVVGGQTALSYQHSGLYETDATAVAYKGKIYLFSAGWFASEDTIRDDFKKLIGSVTFN